ncbi:MAG: helix-turn-helix transcriptional regulator [Pirellulales bacterium]
MVALIESESPPLLIDVREVGRLCAISAPHIYRLCDAGKMPRPLKVGRANRWNRAAIVAWIASGCRPPVKKA